MAITQRVVFVTFAVAAWSSRLAIASEGDSDSNVLRLNRFTFSGNMQRDGVDEWFVMFCPEWYEPCPKFAKMFTELATSYQVKLNTDHFSQRVRFADVECDADKALCDRESISSYPSVSHYHGGKFESRVVGKHVPAAYFAKWIEEVTGEATRADSSSGSSSTGLDAQEDDQLLHDLYSGHSGIDRVTAITAIVVINLLILATNPEMLPASFPFRVGNAPGKNEVSKGYRAQQPTRVSADVGRFIPKQWQQDFTSMEL